MNIVYYFPDAVRAGKLERSHEKGDRGPKGRVLGDDRACDVNVDR